MNLVIRGEFFKDNGGPGGVPITVGTDIISDPFDFITCESGGRKKRKCHLSGIFFIGLDGFVIELADRA